jgi:hypothetical protein
VAAGTSTSWQDTVTAIGTLVTALTVFIAFAALVVQRRTDRRSARAQNEQLEQARLAAQAQVYLNLLDRAERIGLTDALETVRSIPYTDDLAEYWDIGGDRQKDVKIVVEFFNDVRHLIEASMLDADLVYRLWSLSILNCADHLWLRSSWREAPESWWLTGFRQERAHAFAKKDLAKSYYRAFEELCCEVKRLYDHEHCGPDAQPPDEPPPPA